jgi:hypothetical protein
MARAPAMAAALLWLLLVWRWFDTGAARPAWLEAIPPVVLAGGALAALAVSGRGAAPVLARLDFLSTREVWLPVVLALAFRLPFVVQGAAGAVTPDGSLSGIVMLRLLQGDDHFVFVPHVPYSGSLKSHLGAALGSVLDPARAFALASVLFYAAFVAAVVRLAALLPGATRPTVLAAGLYAAFAPPFVTRYSVSNDGNYVEVLALATWALLLVVQGLRHPPQDRFFGMAGGLLGLAFWCHILAVIPLAACALVIAAWRRRSALPALARLSLGLVLGSAPALLWNLAHRGESFRYLLPGGPRVGGEGAGPGLLHKVRGLLVDHLPTLLGSDFGYGAAVDGALRLAGGLGLLLLLGATVVALRRLLWERDPALLAPLVLVLVNLAVALLALPYLPGNARYLLLVFGPTAILIGWALAPTKWGALALGVLIGAGAVGSLAQLPGTARADARWREFVQELEARGIRHCYTDFYLATKINFLSGERLVCSSKLGPTTTEYFFDYRERVDRAPAAAFVAVNSTSARKLARLLQEKAIPFETHDLMKPVLVPGRKTDPQELFPERDFSLR